MVDIDRDPPEAFGPEAVALDILKHHELIRANSGFYEENRRRFSEEEFPDAQVDLLSKSSEELEFYFKCLRKGEFPIDQDWLEEVAMARRRYTSDFEPEMISYADEPSYLKTWRVRTAYDFAFAMFFELRNAFLYWPFDLDWKADREKIGVSTYGLKLMYALGQVHTLTWFDTDRAIEEIRRETRAAIDLRTAGASWYSSEKLSDKWSEPRSPSEWAKQFNMSWDTLKSRIDDKSIRAKKLTSKSYRVHLDDLPATGSENANKRKSE